jgi:hypothetical protein
MICVSKQEWTRQWKLFIDYSKIEILFYGDDNQVEQYFSKRNIEFILDNSDIPTAGWDYLVSEDELYFIVDVDRDVDKLVTPVFIWHDEVKTIRDLFNYLKWWIRNDKLKKLGYSNE